MKILSTLCFMLFLSLIQSSEFKTMQELISDLQTCEEFESTSLGICFMKQDGMILSELNSKKSLIPRSIIKCITTAASLKRLGPDFQFVTSVFADGKIEEGKLKGHLIIQGSGDPSFGSMRFSSQKDVLNKFVEKIKELGITEIEKDIIADASCFEKALCPPSWQYEDLANYYGAGASGLNYHENFYEVTFQLGKRVGALTSILKTSPRIENLSLENEVRMGEKSTGDQAYVFGNEYNLSQVIRGTLPLGSKTYTIKAAFPDPPKVFAEELRKALCEKGIKVKGKAISLYEKPTTNKKLLFESRSPSLVELIEKTHHLSINVYTECFLKAIGQGTLNAGLVSVKRYLSDLGVDTKGVELADGSGLSLKNIVTPKAMCQFLLSVQNEPYFDIWKSTLSVFSDKSSGSYLNFLDGKELFGKVIAKSGSAKNEKSIIGYIDTKSHGKVAFCIICNHYLSSLSSFREKMRPLFSAFSTDSSFSNLSVTSMR